LKEKLRKYTNGSKNSEVPEGDIKLRTVYIT
jgi:hypothetical protein